jgi:hypothetical protein
MVVLMLAMMIATGALVIDRWPASASAADNDVRVVARRSVEPVPTPPDSTSPVQDSIVPASSPAPVDTPKAEPVQVSSRITRWTQMWTNVRRRPEEDAPIARVLRPGTRVEGEPRRYGWWVIYVGGDSAGYVAGGLLSSRAPATRRNPDM